MAESGPSRVCNKEFKRTVVFIHLVTSPTQDVFLRGGIDHAMRSGCYDEADKTNPCSIAIQYNNVGVSDHYEKYNAWRQGNNELSWYGGQPGQGNWHGIQSKGSPMVWTTNNCRDARYQPLNRFGDHYWMSDFNLRLPETTGGWFEVKAYVTNPDLPENPVTTVDGWEFDIVQDVACSGGAGAPKPYNSRNHFAKCGSVNIFHFNSNYCMIKDFKEL